MTSETSKHRPNDKGHGPAKVRRYSTHHLETC